MYLFWYLDLLARLAFIHSGFVFIINSCEEDLSDFLSLVCDLNDKNMNLSKEDLLKTLQKNTISCKDVNFRILGFSLATLNTITSLVLASITIRLYQNYEKNK